MAATMTYSTFLANAMVGRAFGDTTIYPQTIVESMLELTSGQMDRCFWGISLNDAIRFLTAHRLELLQQGQGTLSTPATAQDKESAALSKRLPVGSKISSITSSQGSNTVAFAADTNQLAQSQSKQAWYQGRPGNEESLGATFWGMLYAGLQPAQRSQLLTFARTT
jgi:hypothetical protein